jgi:ABC-type transport system involved in multi-copper enzyme maturation permease subunit
MGRPRQAFWGLARSEFLVGWRNPGFRVAAALCAAVAGLSCTAAGTTASLAAYRVSQQASTVIGLVALLWMCHAACRDAWMGADELVMVKPQSTEAILLGRFLGNLGVVLTVMLFSLAAAAVAQVTWGGTPFRLLAYLHAFARALVPLGTLSTLGFALCTLFGTPVAGGVVALYWILVLSGRDFVSRVFNFSLTQNNAIYALLSAGVLTLMLLVYRRDRRGGNRWPRPLVAATALFLSGGLLVAVLFVYSRHDPPLHRRDGILAIASQHLEPGRRIPGFWLPGGKVPLTGLYPFDGRVLAVGLWAPSVPESLGVLEVLRQIDAEFGSQGATAIAICVSEDTAIARHVARENGYRFLMLHDPGARQTYPPSAGSPVAEAYDAADLPKLVVADRERTVQLVETGIGPDASQAPDTVRQLLSTATAAAVPPQGNPGSP